MLRQSSCADPCRSLHNYDKKCMLKRKKKKKKKHIEEIRNILKEEFLVIVFSFPKLFSLLMIRLFYLF